MLTIFKDPFKGTQILNEALNSKEQNAVGILEDGDALKVIVGSGRMYELLTAVMKVESDRLSKYDDFDEMEDDPVIASALELVVDDATQYSMDMNATIWVDGRHKYKKDIEELFQKINIENKLWGWSYNTAKYGDFFLGLKVEKGEGVTGVIEDEHPSEISRVDIDGKLAGFMKKNVSTRKGIVVDPWKYIHFINSYKPSFEKAKIKVVEEDPDTKQQKEVEKTVTSMYGTSVIENARTISKILRLLEISLVLARLARSPLVRVFYINTEGMQPAERKTLVKDLEEKFREKRTIDVTKKLYKKDYSPLNFTDELFIPYSGMRGDMRAETIGGEVNIGEMVDIEYFRNKLFAALRIPKSYLGFEEALPGMGGATALTRLDIRYARTVKKLQRAILEGIYRLVQVHLAFKYEKEQDIADLSLSMEAISTAEADERLEKTERRVGIANSMLSMKDLAAENMDFKYFLTWIFKEFLNFPNLDITKLIKESPPPAAGGAPGFGPGSSFVPPEEGESPEAYVDRASKFITEKFGNGKCTAGDILKLVYENFSRTNNRVRRFRFKDNAAPSLPSGRENVKVESVEST